MSKLKKLKIIFILFQQKHSKACRKWNSLLIPYVHYQIVVIPAPPAFSLLNSILMLYFCTEKKKKIHTHTSCLSPLANTAQKGLQFIVAKISLRSFSKSVSIGRNAHSYDVFVHICRKILFNVPISGSQTVWMLKGRGTQLMYSSTVDGMQSSLKRARFIERLELQIVLKPSAYIFPM